jgi:AIG1 family protein
LNLQISILGAEALDQSIVVFSFIDRLQRKGISVDDWINKECKQQALLEACGHRYLVIDSSHNDQTKHIDFINRSLTMLNELWKRERMFKSKMFDDIEQEIQRQEKNRRDLFLKKIGNNFQGSEKALRLLLREHIRDELEREPILAEADYLVLEKYLQPIFKSLLQEVARYFEEEIIST